MHGHFQQQGFNLIELMVTVAIVSILAAVAVPGYREYARRAALPQAFANLSDLRIKLEQYYQSNRNYGSATQCGGSPGFFASYNLPPSNFTYQCSLPAGTQTYLLSASGSSGAAIGHVYTLDQNNVRATTTFKAAAVTGRNCWLVKGNEC
ncbi:MAG: type IV pilin protein [Janthinobacterium lividum]